MPAAPFITVTGHAAALREDNIDTDIIFPARFLLITTRQGLGAYAFHDRRYAGDGSEIADHILNQPDYLHAPVIVAGANFGSGSSREQAVWALHDRGIRAVIAASFGEIFHANCLRNGIVPITLPAGEIATLMDAADAGDSFTINLEAQRLAVEGLPPYPFAIPANRRLALLNGWDETDQIINGYSAEISTFETRQRSLQSWLYAQENQTP